MKIEINENTTIFIKKYDLNLYNLEIADKLNRIKIADISIQEITPIRYHVEKVHVY